MPRLIADDLPTESAGKRFRALLDRPHLSGAASPFPSDRNQPALR